MIVWIVEYRQYNECDASCMDCTSLRICSSLEKAEAFIKELSISDNQNGMSGYYVVMAEQIDSSKITEKEGLDSKDRHFLQFYNLKGDKLTVQPSPKFVRK